MLQCNPNWLQNVLLGITAVAGQRKAPKATPEPAVRPPLASASGLGWHEWLVRSHRCCSVRVVGLGRTQCLERRASHCTVRRVRRTAHKLVDDHRRRLCPTQSDTDSATSLRERGPHRSNAKKCPHHRRRHHPVSVTAQADTRRARCERHLKAANHALQLNSQPAGALAVGSPACLPRCTTVSALHKQLSKLRCSCAPREPSRGYPKHTLLPRGQRRTNPPQRHRGSHRLPQRCL